MVSLKLPDGHLRNVTGGKVELPRTGVWIADLVIDERAELPDLVVLDLGEVEMPAAVERAELIGGVTEVRLVGGAGGLGDTARPKHYHRPLARHVLRDLLRDAGETLSATSTAALLGTELEAWTTLALPTGSMISALCRVVGKGANWRVLADGAVWFGAETWPEVDVDVRTIESDGANAAALLGTDIPGLWPGTLLAGRRVEWVRHDLATDRTRVLLGDAA